MVGVGLALGIAGLLVSRFIPSTIDVPASLRPLVRFTWGWPWYATTLVAAVLTITWPLLPVSQPPPGFLAYSMLGFAILAYVIGFVEEVPAWLWLGPVCATVSLLYTPGDVYRLVAVALVCSAAGIATLLLDRWAPALHPGAVWHTRRLQYALPLYATAGSAACLTGIYGTFFDVNAPFYTALPDFLLVYALLALVVLLVEQRPAWLWLVASFAIWGIGLAVQLTAFYMVGVGLALGIAGLLVSRFIPSTRDVPASLRPLARFTWGWPWYATALVAASLTAIWPVLSASQPPPGFLAYSMLGFAILAYVIGFVEEVPAWLWFGPVWATISLLYTPDDVHRLVAVVLVCSIAGMAIRPLGRFWPVLHPDAAGRNRWLQYALPLYTTAGIAACLTGVRGSFFALPAPFYGAFPDLLLAYALLAFVVLLVEQRPAWLWLVAGFACWGIILAMHLTTLYITAIGIGAGIIGLGAGRLRAHPPFSTEKPLFAQSLLRLTWNWPWYIAALFAALLTGTISSQSPATAIISPDLLAFTALAFLLMLVEGTPEWLIFPAGLAAWAIWQSGSLVFLIPGYSALCVLIYATQFIWRIIPPATRWMSETLLSTVLGVGGQSLVVLAIITQNGLSADAGSLAQIGVGTLSMLAVLVFTTGRLLPGNVTRRSALQHDEARHQTRVQRARAWQHWFSIGAGMLLCMAVSWELAATRQTTLDLLTLAPASYLIIIAPFVTRNDTLIGHQRVGQILAMLGAALLLLPTLWLSFSNTNLLPTLILLGETLVLLLIGITTRIRVFVLSSASLIIIGGLHMLFLQSLGIPTSLALALLGTVLLAIATGFALARHRLQSAWANWE